MDAEAEQLLNELCAVMEFAVPLTWQSIQLSAQATVLTTTTTTAVVDQDGTRTSVPMPDEMHARLDRFRAACYRPARGTWYSATITLHRDGEPDVRLRYDEKPEWGAWPHPASFVRDLQFFPRDDEYIPDWLREQIELTDPDDVAAPPTPTKPRNVFPQKEVLDQLTSLLLDALPADWQRLLIEYRVVGKHSTARIRLVRPDGETDSWDPPLQAWHRFQDLRRGMYTEGAGTWFGAQYKLVRPNRFAVKYNWAARPDFTNEPAPDEFLLEQSRFPRDEAHQPDWYRAGLERARDRL